MRKELKNDPLAFVTVYFYDHLSFKVNFKSVGYIFLNYETSTNKIFRTVHVKYIFRFFVKMHFREKQIFLFL